jgi:hypothetical protein
MSEKQYRFTLDTIGPEFMHHASHPLATVIGRELDRIGGAHGGNYTATDVVSLAQLVDNPLHTLFEWDDAVAAAKYRHDQAMVIIRSVVRSPCNPPKTA